jgi:hypothetical protein
MTQEMRDMKKLLIALTLATLATSSALAKSSHSSGPAVDSYSVTAYGQVVGRDPDPNVRLEMLRDGALLAD